MPNSSTCKINWTFLTCCRLRQPQRRQKRRMRDASQLQAPSNPPSNRPPRITRCSAADSEACLHCTAQHAKIYETSRLRPKFKFSRRQMSEDLCSSLQPHLPLRKAASAGCMRQYAACLCPLMSSNQLQTPPRVRA